ncbi:MAG: hypothetical protein K2X44_07455 [Magnetospirillum sp.]|nr:hypothetical protein [Magnetospirillum sp.]
MAQAKLHYMQQHILLGSGQSAHRALYIEPQFGCTARRCPLAEYFPINTFLSR